MSALDPRVHDLLQATNFVHVATLMPDGAPHSVATWVDVQDGRPCFFTNPTSRKARNLARDPRVAMSVIDRTQPYRTASLRGTIGAVLEGDEGLTVIDRISEKYTGSPFPMRSGVVFLIDVERWAFLELPFEETPAAR